jgi:hypothetical protein
MNGNMNLVELLPVDSLPNPEMLEMKNLFSPGCKGLAAPSRLQTSTTFRRANTKRYALAKSTADPYLRMSSCHLDFRVINASVYNRASLTMDISSTETKPAMDTKPMVIIFIFIFLIKFLLQNFISKHTIVDSENIQKNKINEKGEFIGHQVSSNKISKSFHVNNCLSIIGWLW